MAGLSAAAMGALVPKTQAATPAEAFPAARGAAPAVSAAGASLSAVAEPALSPTSLDALYGTGTGDATNIAVSDQMLQASDTGNAVIAGGSIVSGAVAFSGGAFSNFNGVGNFVFNTGNNNTLQGSINITILTPPK